MTKTVVEYWTRCRRCETQHKMRVESLSVAQVEQMLLHGNPSMNVPATCPCVDDGLKTVHEITILPYTQQQEEK